METVLRNQHRNLAQYCSSILVQEWAVLTVESFDNPSELLNEGSDVMEWRVMGGEAPVQKQLQGESVVDAGLRCPPPTSQLHH